jgi:hypothetical protein
VPIGWVAAAGAVAGLAGSAMQAGAATDAANTQAQSAANAQGISQQQYQDTVNRNAPFTQSGYGALSALDYGLGIGPQTATGGNPQSSGGNGYDPSSGYRIGPGGSISQAIGGGTPYGSIGQNGYSLGQTSGQPGQLGGSGVPIAPGSTPGGQPSQPGQTGGLGYGSLTTPFTAANWQQLSPAYNFQKQQGQQGVLNSDAAGAGALSGSAQKDLIDYNQSAANTSFNNAFNQYQTQQGNIFSRLSGIAQLGQSSANNTGQQGTALAGQAAQSATNIGTAQAGGIVGSANAISGGLSNAVPWLTAGGGTNSNNNASNWDTENTSNFQDFQSSDRRLKTDIHLVGKLDSGLNVYTFKYRESPAVTHMGVMADEVSQVIPEAVSTDDSGYLRVSYRMLR